LNLLFQLSPSDRTFLPHLKGVLYGHSVGLNDTNPLTITEVEMRARERRTKYVCVTNQKLLSRLLGRQDDRKQPTLDDYAGSIIERSGFEYLILNPVEHLATVPYGNFFTTVISPSSSSRIRGSQSLSSLGKSLLQIGWILYISLSAALITSLLTSKLSKRILAITCVGYCGIWIDRASNTVFVSTQS
jgi:hypothetical protein